VRGAAREALTVAIALVIAALGLRAVWAVVA
jgi:hypothetical protein